METKGKAVDSVIQYQLHKEQKDGGEAKILLLYPKVNDTSKNTKSGQDIFTLCMSYNDDEKECTFIELKGALESGVLILYKDEGILDGREIYCNNVFLFSDDYEGRYDCHILGPYDIDYGFSSSTEDGYLILS